MEADYLYYIAIIAAIFYLQYYILAFYWNISLKGKSILITGCDTGFGNETSKALDKIGCIVFATCLNAETAQMLNKDTSSSTIVKLMDVTKVEQIKSVANEIAEYLESKNLCLYGIVNNAGICEVSPFECIAPETFNKIISVNFTGVANVTRAFLPLMRNTKRNKYLSSKYAAQFLNLYNRGQAGRIVNVASVAGTVGLPWASAYCASKHAVMGLSESLRIELNEYCNIWLSTVEPSFTQTPFFTNAMGAGERSRKSWRELENSKELMKSYNLEKFIYCLENRKAMMKLATNYNINKVVNVIIAGLRSKFPLQHYYPTYTEFLTDALKKYTPEWLFEFALQKLAMSK
eukprot:424834_1